MKVRRVPVRINLDSRERPRVGDRDDPPRAPAEQRPRARIERRTRGVDVVDEHRERRRRPLRTDLDAPARSPPGAPGAELASARPAPRETGVDGPLGPPLAR